MNTTVKKITQGFGGLAVLAGVFAGAGYLTYRTFTQESSVFQRDRPVQRQTNARNESMELLEVHSILHLSVYNSKDHTYRIYAYSNSPPTGLISAHYTSRSETKIFDRFTTPQDVSKEHELNWRRDYDEFDALRSNK